MNDEVTPKYIAGDHVRYRAVGTHQYEGTGKVIFVEPLFTDELRKVYVYAVRVDEVPADAEYEHPDSQGRPVEVGELLLGAGEILGLVEENA